MTSLWKNFQHTWSTLEFTGTFTVHSYQTTATSPTPSRYLNNPEAMGGAAYFGLALISGSKLVLSLAVIRHLANWWFLSSVEQWVGTIIFLHMSYLRRNSRFFFPCSPHMRKLYGDSLRKDAGFVKVMKSVASKNARIFKSRAGRHAPDLERVATEVIGTFDKVYEETADAVEEFLARCE